MNQKIAGVGKSLVYVASSNQIVQRLKRLLLLVAAAHFPFAFSQSSTGAAEVFRNLGGRAIANPRKPPVRVWQLDRRQQIIPPGGDLTLARPIGLGASPLSLWTAWGHRASPPSSVDASNDDIQRSEGHNLTGLLGCVPRTFRIGTSNRLSAAIGA